MREILTAPFLVVFVSTPPLTLSNSRVVVLHALSLLIQYGFTCVAPTSASVEEPCLRAFPPSAKFFQKASLKSSANH